MTVRSTSSGNGASSPPNTSAVVRPAGCSGRAAGHLMFYAESSSTTGGTSSGVEIKQGFCGVL
jgi:hypothetical protein